MLGHVLGKGNHVLGLVLAELQVSHLLEHLALRAATTVVDGHADNAMLGKQLHPPIVAVGPGIVHGLVARTAVDINQHGVFLGGVEIGRQNLPSIHIHLGAIGQCEGRVADFQEFLLAEVEGLQFLGKLVVVLQNAHQFAFVGVKFKLTRLSDGAININKVAEVVAETRLVGTLATNHLAHLTFQIDSVNLTLDGRFLSGLEKHFLAIEAVDLGHVPRAVGELLHQSAIKQIEVDMVVAALLGSHQEAVTIVEEVPVVGDVDVIVIGLIVKHTALARGGVGGQNLQMVLMAVEALDG